MAPAPGALDAWVLGATGYQMTSRYSVEEAKRRVAEILNPPGLGTAMSVTDVLVGRMSGDDVAVWRKRAFVHPLFVACLNGSFAPLAGGSVLSGDFTLRRFIVVTYIIGMAFGVAASVSVALIAGAPIVWLAPLVIAVSLAVSILWSKPIARADLTIIANALDAALS